MKKFLAARFVWLLLFVTCFQAGFAQVRNSAVLVEDTATVIEERLVALALQTPEFKNIEHQNKIDEYTLKAAQNQWMNLLSFSAQFNEQTLSKNTAPNAAYVYPRYNVGVTVPLGTLFSKTAIKSAKESVAIGKNNIDILRKQMRQEVISRYKEYVALTKLIAIQGELLNDVQVQLVQVEEKFRAGTLPIETYNAAQSGYNAQTATLINLRLQRDLKELELEKMIGVPLETVLKK